LRAVFHLAPAIVYQPVPLSSKHPDSRGKTWVLIILAPLRLEPSVH